MKKSVHCKEDINKLTQIMIFKATKKPVKISVKTRWIQAGWFMCVAFLLFFSWTFSSLLQQNQIIIEKNQIIASLEKEKQAVEEENIILFGMIEEKDTIISIKTEEIEQRLESLDDFKQYIMEYVGLEQGSPAEYSAIASRSGSVRDFNLERGVGTENIDLDEIDEKLIDFQLELSQKFTDFDVLFDEIVERIDYIERFPDFFPTAGRITSGFAYRTNPVTYRYEFHKGIDIANNRGTSIRVAGAGKVIDVSYDYLSGKYIVIDHGFGFTSRYAHLYEFKVEVGEEVAKGQEIATMGSTGQSTGPHLHFEIHIWGTHINPTNIKNYFE
ncbi:MAG: M23 family metallopeptidase [Eubacteriales bacterium]|nr:M23 family metallopeptidase [Eubacteriales bacterium]